VTNRAELPDNALLFGYWLLSYLEAWIFLPALQHLIWPKTLAVSGCGELGWVATDRALTVLVLWLGWALNLTAGLMLLILCWWKARAFLDSTFGRASATVTLVTAYPCSMLVHGLV
jgi:hypothetical protein